MKRFVCTWAQNDTPTDPGFWAALLRLPGALRVVRGYYKNPTSIFEAYEEETHGWAPEVLPFLIEEREELVPGRLTLHGNIRTQPTATNPLSSMEVYAGQASAIFGHPKRALVTVATASRQARLLMTTGACTVANYSRSNAGAKGIAHHILGALVIEVDDQGRFFPFQITWDKKSQSFTHLDKRYTAKGVSKAPRASVCTRGDFHNGKHDMKCVHATREMENVLDVEHVMHHDFFDNSARNHHESRSKRIRYAKRFDLVSEEVESAGHMLAAQVRRTPRAQHHVIRSNHDEALDRWVEEHDDQRDPPNNKYWHELCARLWNDFEQTGTFPDAFPAEMRRLAEDYPELAGVHFLTINEELVILKIAYHFHGHNGVGGTRGTPASYRKLGVKVVLAHYHYFYIGDGVYVTGHNSVEDHNYNKLPNAWTQGNVMTYADGKRTIMAVIDGAWRGEGEVTNAAQRPNRPKLVNRPRVRRGNNPKGNSSPRKRTPVRAPNVARRRPSRAGRG